MNFISKAMLSFSRHSWFILSTTSSIVRYSSSHKPFSWSSSRSRAWFKAANCFSLFLMPEELGQPDPVRFWVAWIPGDWLPVRLHVSVQWSVCVQFWQNLPLVPIYVAERPWAFLAIFVVFERHCDIISAMTPLITITKITTDSTRLAPIAHFIQALWNFSSVVFFWLWTCWRELNTDSWVLSPVLAKQTSRALWKWRYSCSWGTFTGVLSVPLRNLSRSF